MKRLDNFGSIDDFEFERELAERNKVVKGIYGLDSLAVKFDPIPDANHGGVSSRPFTLNSLLSGGSSTDTGTTASYTPQSASTQIEVDYSDQRNLAYFGSVYTRVSIAIDLIKDKYQNGFAVIETINLATTNLFEFPYSGTLYTTWDTSQANKYKEFELVRYNGVTHLDAIAILSAVTDTTGATLTLASALTATSGNFLVVPKNDTIANFYNDVPAYERALVDPQPDRSNSWPTHSASTKLLLYSDTEYDTFIATELAWGSEADLEGVSGSQSTNILWNQLTPDHLKNLDNYDDILQKMIITFGFMFDKIRMYQNQMGFAHSIQYDDYNHIPRALVMELAQLWGWSLAHDTKHSDLTTHQLAIYDHYYSSDRQKMSLSDINFERWRRILANAVYIYKKKGTKRALRELMSIYSIPDNLLVIQEYIKNEATGDNFYPIDEGIYITTATASTRYTVDSLSREASYIDFRISNSKYLDIGISEAAAVTADWLDWANVNYTGATDINGNPLELTGNSYTTYQFIERLINEFVPSDGSYKYADKASYLEDAYKQYLEESVNAYQLGSFEAFVQFIEENFEPIVDQFVPASSKLFRTGTFYENLPFHPQKHKWVENLTPAQPFNDEVTFVMTTPGAAALPKQSAFIQSLIPTAAKEPAPDSAIVIEQTVASKNLFLSDDSPQSMTAVASKQNQYDGSAQSLGIVEELLTQYSDTVVSAPSYGGDPVTLDSPLLMPTTELSGATAYTAFTEDVILLSNDNEFYLSLSASNISFCGYSSIDVALYRKMSDTEIFTLRAKEYTVIAVKYEAPGFPDETSGLVGVYELQTVSAFTAGDLVRATNAIPGYMNEIATVVHVDYTDHLLHISPPFGVGNVPFRMNIKLQKYNYHFDWADPIFETSVDTYSSGVWDFPILGEISGANGYSTTGTVSIGGVDADERFILRDKEEYFLTYKVSTEVPSGYTGETYFDAYSGHNLLGSGINVEYIDNLRYYGNYFIHMKYPREPIIQTAPVHSGATDTAAVYIEFKGVGDADKLYIQFYDDGSTGGEPPSQSQQTADYTTLSSDNWATATTITLDVKVTADDRSVYTVQTTLDPHRWYWFRIGNAKSKESMFGYPADGLAYSEPQLFYTATYRSIDRTIGIRPNVPPGGGPVLPGEDPVPPPKEDPPPPEYGG